MLALFRVKKRLVASAYPGVADEYVCDKCGTDLTKYFRPVQSHSLRPLGPERLACTCGQRYLTGAVEWDHLSDWEIKQRVRHALLLPALGLCLAAVFGALAYTFSRASRAALVAALTALVPICIIESAFWLSVLKSIWRTRIGSSR